MSKLKIFVCAHKADPNTRNDAVYQPIHAGKALHEDVDLGFPGDDTGDNISAKNEEWCELTALYWVWKNSLDYDYVGLASYRRYLDMDVNDGNVDEIMAGVDIATAKWECKPTSLGRDLALGISREAYAIFADTFLSMHPEASDAFIDHFCRSNSIPHYQLFLCRRDILNEYANSCFLYFLRLKRGCCEVHMPGNAEQLHISANTFWDSLSGI